MKTQVVIFDDNSNRREGLQLLINSMENMECSGTFNDCRSILNKIKQSKPDVILMDIDMPFVNGIEGVKIVRSQYPDLKILMQTVFEDDEKVFASICAGANGYILKQANPLTLISSINEVLEGGGPMTPIIAKKVLELFSKSHTHPKKEDFDLTKRELDILRLLVKGYSYKMIASECHISYPTVNSHVSSIYRKLQVQSATGAVSKAIRKGIID